MKKYIKNSAGHSLYELVTIFPGYEDLFLDKIERYSIDSISEGATLAKTILSYYSNTYHPEVFILKNNKMIKCISFNGKVWEPETYYTYIKEEAPAAKIAKELLYKVNYIR
jgi:hypothetical protein